MSREALIAKVAKHLHAEQRIEAARAIAVFSGADPRKIDTEDLALEYCNSLLYWCLNNDRYADAASLLWTSNLFTPEPNSTRAIWNGLQRSNSLLLMGAASMSKSYSAGVWLLLDWIRDPEYTSINLVGPSENHLKDNLFTHLVTLHSNSSLPLPGQVGELFIGLDPKKRKGSITGIVIPLGKRPAGRLQGRKRVPRKEPHPTLGGLSRIRFFLDELEKIPIGVFKDIDNVFANLDDDVDGFKIIGAFNPEDPSGQVAARCEPPNGWEAFNPETDTNWVSKRGWDVVRLDAARCENVVERRTLYPGLQTHVGFERIIANAGGTDTPGYWTMARACFPRQGAIYSVIPSTLVSRLKGEFMFAEEPVLVGSADLALEGKDSAEFAVGRFGKAVGIRFPVSALHPRGKEILFTQRRRLPGEQPTRRFRWALQVDQIFSLTRGDTVSMTDQVRKAAVLLKIPPANLMLDRTGNGAGVHDLLKSVWSPEVRGVNYQESATERKILEEDSKTAKEEYGRAVSELWFALKKWAEFDFLKIKPEALSEELDKELSGRRYDSAKQNKVESKKEFIARGNSSPNKADALTLLVHAVRVSLGCVPSASDDLEGIVGSVPADENAPVPLRIGATDQPDYLDDDQMN